MKEYYIKCLRCEQLNPRVTYFLSKEENSNLTERQKQLCYSCYLAEKKKGE